MHEAIITVHDGFVLTPAPPFAAIAQGVMPATTGYFAWGCFPYFSWEREPPRPYRSGIVANGKSGQPGRFEEDGEEPRFARRREASCGDGAFAPPHHEG